MKIDKNMDDSPANGLMSGSDDNIADAIIQAVNRDQTKGYYE